MKKYLLSLLMVSLFFSCSKEDVNVEAPIVQEEQTPLVANFRFELETINEKEDLKIENLSSGALEYTWDFGNDQIFSDEIPDFKYLTHGIYDVTLSVKNSKGEVDSVVKTINVLCQFGGGIHSTDESEL